MSVVVVGDEFQDMIRLQNTNIPGKIKIVHALTSIKGIGRRYATIMCRKGEIPLNLRAGQLSKEQVQKVNDILENPARFGIPVHFLNRRRDFMTAKDMHVFGNDLNLKNREDIELLKKIKSERGVRHMWHLKVRGQHTKSTGRFGKSVGVAKKKQG